MHALAQRTVKPRAAAFHAWNSKIQQHRSVATLILLRHGQSTYNGPDARFTGWIDVPLTVHGRVQAVAAGQLLRSKGVRVDVAFTSQLQRAHETCELALASMAGGPDTTGIQRDWRLNERHYGAVQGLFKNDPSLLEKFTKPVVRAWRRSMDARPPPMEPSHEHWQPPPAPLTESLADCQARALECFQTIIAPALFDDLEEPTHQRTVLVVAHSNTIRSLMAAFDSVPADRVPHLHCPNSVPILYRFDPSTRQCVSHQLESAAGGSHARWLVSGENHRAVLQALQPGGLFARAFFDALDLNGDRVLTAEEITWGLRDLLQNKEKEPLDCVVVGLAKKIARELEHGSSSSIESLSLQEFERRAAEAYRGLERVDEKEANESII